MEDALRAAPLSTDRPDAHRTTVTGSRALLVLLAFAMVLGVGLRLKLYFDRAAYWHDEASLVFNIFEKPVPELLGPLDFAQAAPPGFLIIERAMHVLLGRSELAMRLAPLIAAMLGFAIFAMIVRRIFGDVVPAVALLLIVLWGCSERLIWHASEAKQYSFDVLASLLLFAVALQESRPSTTRMIACAAISSVAIWFSYPTAFVFGGISLAVIPTSRSRRRWLTWLAGNGVFAASFLTLFWFCVRHQQVGELYSYWLRDFIDFRQPWLLPIWLVRRLASIANYPFDLGGPVLFPLCVLGVVSLWMQRRGQMLAMLTAPIGLVLVASALHQYPFTGTRLTLFLAPSVFILAGFGLATLVDLIRRNRRWKWLAAPVAAYLIGVAIWHACVIAICPPVYGDMPAAVRYVAAHHADGDTIYANKISEFKVYWPDMEVRDIAELSQSKPAGRFWVVLSYRPSNTNRVVKPLIAPVEPRANQLDTFSVPGACAVLFEDRD
jgi:hypothetical protein